MNKKLILSFLGVTGTLGLASLATFCVYQTYLTEALRKESERKENLLTIQTKLTELLNDEIIKKGEKIKLDEMINLQELVKANQNEIKSIKKDYAQTVKAQQDILVQQSNQQIEWLDNKFAQEGQKWNLIKERLEEFEDVQSDIVNKAATDPSFWQWVVGRAKKIIGN